MVPELKHGTVRVLFRYCLIGLAITFTPLAQAQGVEIGKPSMMRNLVPAKQVESQAGQQYGQLLKEADRKHALAKDDHPQVVRLRAIARKLTPHAERFNPRAKTWKWEVNLIGSKQINAFCMPGGKIAFYTGILDQLKLTDDEVAMIMGHEIAHALWEHARERLAKSVATEVGASLLGELVGGGKYSGLFRMGDDLLTLKFSRSDESEADLVGLDLAARAGYDPRAGLTLWQKMAAANKGGATRIPFHASLREQSYRGHQGTTAKGDAALRGQPHLN
jgi:Zn-dependent protease with chaperone function